MVKKDIEDLRETLKSLQVCITQNNNDQQLQKSVSCLFVVERAGDRGLVKVVYTLDQLRTIFSIWFSFIGTLL